MTAVQEEPPKEPMCLRLSYLYVSGTEKGKEKEREKERNTVRERERGRGREEGERELVSGGREGWLQ